MSDINPYYYSWREISIEQWCDILQNHEITTQECIDILKVVRVQLHLLYLYILRIERLQAEFRLFDVLFHKIRFPLSLKFPAVDRFSI